MKISAPLIVTGMPQICIKDDAQYAENAAKYVERESMNGTGIMNMRNKTGNKNCREFFHPKICMRTPCKNGISERAHIQNEANK